jgi:hypothetical protein
VPRFGAAAQRFARAIQGATGEFIGAGKRALTTGFCPRSRKMRSPAEAESEYENGAMHIGSKPVHQPGRLRAGTSGVRPV